jgi:hypothetical protein
MTLKNTFRRSATTATRLVRTFVRTGDPRCPLVAVWKLAGSTDAAAADEPSLLQPAMERLRRHWRAFHLLFAGLRYSTV